MVNALTLFSTESEIPVTNTLEIIPLRVDQTKCFGFGSFRTKSGNSYAERSQEIVKLSEQVENET